MPKTFHGSCHCGAVKFTAPLDLSEGVRRCNCTYCFKTGYLKVFAYGDSVVVTEGADRLASYRAPNSSWPPDHIHHHFCVNCGTQVFSHGYLEIPPFDGWFHAINARVLDDLPPKDLAAAPVIYEDGLHDKQMEAPAFTGHL